MSIETNRLADTLADRAERLDSHGPTMDDILGRAHTIHRRRRVSTGVAAFAALAVLAPVGVWVATQLPGSSDQGPDPAQTPTQAPDPTPSATTPDYLLDGVWHRADGEVVELPRREYSSAVVWNDQLVASYHDGEAYFVADVIDSDGNVVDSFDTTGPVVRNDARSTIAWIDTDGSVRTRWAGGQHVMGTVDLSAGGEGVAWTASGITGGPDCRIGVHGCHVYLNHELGEGSTVMRADGTTESPVDGALKFFDPADGGPRGDSGVFAVGTLTEVADDHTCGGVYDLERDHYRFETCDFQTWQISPDGAHVAAPPSYFDGLGPASISILDADTGDETARFAPEGGFVGDWAWSADGRLLLFDTYDGAQWHLMAMATDGALEELAEPEAGEDFDSPFTLIQH